MTTKIMTGGFIGDDERMNEGINTFYLDHPVKPGDDESNNDQRY
jgi:hypothetical protein